MEIFLSGAVAFAAGAAVSFVNYLISRVLIAKTGSPSAASPLRSVLTVAFLASAYFIAKALEVSVPAVLVGGALGMTAGLAVFTVLLMRAGKKEEDNTEGKE